MRFLIIALITFSSISMLAKESKTVWGDCTSENKEERYKSKTYSDLDKDGKFDKLLTVKCDNEFTVEDYEEGIMHYDPTLYKHLLIQDEEIQSGPFKGKAKLLFEIRDSISYDLIFTEEKDLHENKIILHVK